MKVGQRLLGLSWVVCIGLGLAPSVRAQVLQEVAVPVVTCPVDGQIGAQALKGPRSVRKALPEGLASRVAYYRGLQGNDSILVLGPRGWKCIGLYGSNGDTMFVVPPQVNPKQDGRFQGPVIEVRFRYGGTSGRMSVASTAGPLFKVAAAFIDEVEASFPNPEKYRRVPWPNEWVSRVNDRLVTYVDPPATVGTGTEGRLVASTLPIYGVVAFTEESDLVALAMRFDGADVALVTTILSDFQATAMQLIKPTSSVPTTTQSSAPQKPVVQTADLSSMAGIWVPVAEYPRGCAPSTAWIASTDQAMKIEPRAILRYEFGCTVQSTSAQPDGSLRVGASCRHANESETATLLLSLKQGRVTVREKSGTKVYAKCQR